MRPADLVVAFCTPTTIEHHRAQLHKPERHHYARMVSPRESHFTDVIVRPYQRFEQEASSLGARVCPETSLARFAALLAEPACKALILVAHWHEDQVEFFDGFASVADVVAAVPPAYRGVLDLSVCNARPLAVALRQMRPHLGPIKYSNCPVNYAFWLSFYACLVGRLAESEADYWDAHEATMLEFQRAAGLR
jgi:hypothetical protein